MTDFHDLYHQYSDDIFRFALFLCGNASDAEDITAETFTRVITGKSVLRASSVKGYLLTVARNLYAESSRRQSRMTELPEDMIDKHPSIEQAYTDKKRLSSLLVYLQTLSVTERTALLFRVDDVPYSEIATTLNITLAAAKISVHRARLKLARWQMSQD
jgi:RNA polymerase sigma-70 factor, ECF subfamily